MSTQELRFIHTDNNATSAATLKWKQIYDFDHEFGVCVCALTHNFCTMLIKKEYKHRVSGAKDTAATVISTKWHVYTTFPIFFLLLFRFFRLRLCIKNSVQLCEKCFFVVVIKNKRSSRQLFYGTEILAFSKFNHTFGFLPRNLCSSHTTSLYRPNETVHIYLYI